MWLIFNLLTLHRPINTDNETTLTLVLNTLKKINAQVLWPLHPRLKNKIASLNIPENIHITEPLSYFEMLWAVSTCNKVFTDSGGLQKEAYWLRKPCITLRDETEWNETRHNNWNMIAGANASEITAAYNTVIDPSTWYPLYGDGHAAEKIAAILKSQF